MSRLRGACRRAAMLACVIALFAASPALAYVGESFLMLDGVKGDWKGEDYKGWIRVDAAYWDGKVEPFGSLRLGPLNYSAPSGPKDSSGRLIMAFDKDSKMLPKLMGLCAAKAALGGVTYAENSQRARAPGEIGARPASMPAFYEYRLSGVQVADCPVAQAAPQQAIVLTFKTGTRINYAGTHTRVVFPKVPVSQLVPLGQAIAGRSKAWVLNWFAVANDATEGQCPKLAVKPTEADYYALMTRQDAEAERAVNARNGGVNIGNGQMGLRGPHKLDAMRLPGIVPDPGLNKPVSTIARGFDLDGDDGSGKPPKGIRKHANFTSPDGRKGIDNQLFAAEGCIPSFLGHKGFIMQFANKQMWDGQMSIIVEVAGIDDDSNDDSVEVRLAYSHDPMAKTANGLAVLPDYTFRLTDRPEFANYFTRFSARIRNGVIESDVLELMAMNLGQYGTPNELKLAKARVRLEITPEGNLKGLLGGYMDWRAHVSRYMTSAVEVYHNFTVPGLYNALRSHADGLPDPATGELTGISSAYDMEGLPIFLHRSEAARLAEAGGAAKAQPASR